jgi:hypothetical protein
MKKIFFSIIIFTVMGITSCGGGGGATVTPTKSVTLKLSTNGTPSAQLAGVGVDLVLPDGVTPALNADGAVEAKVVSASSVALPGSSIPPIYTPATATAKGRLSIAVVTSNSVGFGAGEFATVTLTVASPQPPGQSDFTLTSFIPVDILGNVATGLTTSFSLTMN